MLWFWCKMLLIALGLFILITILNAVSGESASGDSGSGASKKAAGKRNYRFGEKKFRVAVQYKKEQREDGAYLYRIRPREETDLEDEIPILLDFEYDSEQFFLLRSHRKSNCIRRYDVYRSETDPIELYTLLDVDEPWKTKMLLNCVELNDYCRKHYAVSAQELQKLRRRPLPAQREPGTAHQPEAQPCKPALPRMRKRRYDEQAARCEHARSLVERLVWLRQQVEHIGSDDDLEAAVGIGQIAHVLNRKVQLAGMGMASCHVDHLGRGVRRLDGGRLVHDPVGDHARPRRQLQHGAVADGRTYPV